MVNRPKNKGTRRERMTDRVFKAAGLKSKHLKNNAPSRDVDVQIGNRTAIVEAKDRAALNPHKTVKQAQERWPDEIVALVWHRTSVKEGRSIPSPDGPTLAMLPVEDLAALWSLADGVYKCLQDLPRDPDELGTWVGYLKEKLNNVLHRGTRW